MYLRIESEDDSERFLLNEGYHQVITQLEFPEHLRVLCFLDNHNEAELVAVVGGTNRGFHVPLNEYYEQPAHVRVLRLPTRITKLITFDVDGNPSYDNLVYLHGSTTKSKPAFIMALAHELQHVLQYANHRELWMESAIMDTKRRNFKADYANSSVEREAMVISRRIASDICGRQVVSDYIKQQIEAAGRELIRWNYQNDWNVNFLDLQTGTDLEVKNHRSVFPNSAVRI